MPSVAFITGAGKGLGREMALAFSSSGYRVVVTGIEGVKRTAQEIRDQRGEALDIFLDLSIPAQIEDAVERVLEEWGQIDVLVNNAGIEGPTASLVDVDPADWDKTIQINLTGVFLCDRAVAPHMIERRSGVILHISSIGGLQAYPLRSPYAVSKRGLVALTETLALELGSYGIRVNAVCPGPVRGERMKRVIVHRAKAEGKSEKDIEKDFRSGSALGRMVEAEDVTGLVLFLASDAAKNITGQSIRVCGGYKL